MNQDQTVVSGGDGGTVAVGRDRGEVLLTVEEAGGGPVVQVPLSPEQARDLARNLKETARAAAEEQPSAADAPPAEQQPSAAPEGEP